MGMIAVQQVETALEFASDDLRGDMEVVMTVVRQDGEALEYANKAVPGFSYRL